MGKYIIRYLCAGLAVLIVSCQTDAPKIGDIINTMRRNVSPRSIDLGGIVFTKTREELAGLFPSLSCQKKSGEIEICSWKRSPKDPQNYFQRIAQIKLTFVRDTLKAIRAAYSEMLDVEYVNFERAIREKYAYAIAGRVIDSTGSNWQYDSLNVTL